jgi:predicted nuclease of predicted toxin-antitoxin system
VPGRFPLLTDENVPGPVIEGLRHSGWDVVRVIEVFGERSIDARLFEHAVAQGRVLVSTDQDCLAIANRWLSELRSFRLVYWEQSAHQHTAVGRFLEAFEKLAQNPHAFAACIEYLRP